MIPLKHCIAAFRFLTIFPLPGRFGTDIEDLNGALAFFPFVGIVLGILSGTATWVTWNFFPPFVASVLITFLLLSFSGALHLDGLADCADGFFSSRDRARTLEIMRDSRIGVMGVIAVVMILLLKVSILTTLKSEQAVQAAILMPIAGRTALVVMIFLLPYVHKEGGLGTPFYRARNGWTLLLALIIFLGSCMVILRFPGLIIGLVSMCLVFLFSRLCHVKIGGATGDTLGASCEITEAATLFAFFL